MTLDSFAIFRVLLPSSQLPPTVSKISFDQPAGHEQFPWLMAPLDSSSVAPNPTGAIQFLFGILDTLVVDL